MGPRACPGSGREGHMSHNHRFFDCTDWVLLFKRKGLFLFFGWGLFQAHMCQRGLLNL